MLWDKWVHFTTDPGLDPFLQASQEKMPFLQIIFAHQVHSSNLAASGSPIQARSIEDYLWFIAQTFPHVGANDPCLNSAHVNNFWLQRTIKVWKTSDPAPMHVKPITIQVIHRIAIMAQYTSTTDIIVAAADMIIMAFFFLLRPGKYTDNDKTQFSLQDVQLFISDMRLALDTAPLE
jgi:hypothetical protein